MALAGCGGGGGGGGGAALPAPVVYSGLPPWPASTGAALTFETPEYQAQYGLAQMRASRAYAAGLTGSGIKMAIIDTGVDTSHADFAGRIDPASIDIVAARPGGANVQDQFGHGTTVAGVALAAKNDIGMHGVAYSATLLAIRSDAPGACIPASGSCSFLYSDVALAIDHAIANGARVINLSLGGSTPSSADFVAAYSRAIAAGIVIVAAAGNDGGANPIYPARYAATPTANGQALSAGALTAAGLIASFSNRAGDTASAHLMAAGVGIQTTNLGGGFTSASGTSYSSPLVAGAATVVLSHSPFLTAQQVVTILKQTATPLGESAIYGLGLVNLGAAMTPIGLSVVPMGTSVTDAAASLTATRLRLGTAFGDALQGRHASGGILVLDDYRRAFIADFSATVSTGRNPFNLARYLQARAPRLVEQTFGPQAYLSIGLHDGASPEYGGSEPWNEDRFSYLLFSGDIDQRNSVAVGAGISLRDQFGLSAASGDPIGRFLADSAFATPYHALIQPRYSLVFGHRLGAGWEVRAGSGVGDAGLGDDLASEIAFRFQDGSRLVAQVGSVRERRALLASQGTGAFATDGDSQTRFGTISGLLNLRLGVRLLGSYSAGITDSLYFANSLLRDIDDIRSSSWSLGLSFDDVRAENDVLTLALSQPLRVERGRATLALPVARSIAGDIIRESRPVDLAPSGRELDIEISYEQALAPGERIGLNAMLQVEPGHVRGANSEAVFLFRYRKTF